MNGEQIAVDFLTNKGYNIVFRNWRTGKKEVDIVASKGDVLVFVEVKTRSKNILQFPEEAVGHRKQEALRVAAGTFLEQYTAYRSVRFDIVSVLLNDEHAREIVHFEEAFH
ncbi:YraN family protein [Nemorincola caseinilytica]|uniref:UPF0102 protein GCM10023093_30030 n=2 Tax=Nemorincola caseinilytica TaxID=2054315 RepID=A0ABP8NMQ8_9BACT